MKDSCYTVYTVYTVYAVYPVYTVYTVCTVYSFMPIFATSTPLAVHENSVMELKSLQLLYHDTGMITYIITKYIGLPVHA